MPPRRADFRHLLHDMTPSFEGQTSDQPGVAARDVTCSQRTGFLDLSGVCADLDVQSLRTLDDLLRNKQLVLV